MPHRRAIALLILAALSSPGLRAERMFVGMLEAESYHAIVYGTAAFSRTADLPDMREAVNARLTRALALPDFSGISLRDSFRVVQTMDFAQPRGENNPAHVALLPLAGSASVVHSALAALYADHQTSGATTHYFNPTGAHLATNLFLADSGRRLLVSTSREALLWSWENRAMLLDAPSPSLPGSLRMLVHPNRFANLINARSHPAAAFAHLDRLLEDCATLTLSATMDGQVLALAARAKPSEGTALAALAAALRAPPESLWNRLPEQAFLSWVFACDSPELLTHYLAFPPIWLLRPTAGLAPNDAFEGGRLAYLAPMAAQRSLCWVQIEPLRDAAAVQLVLQRLDVASAERDFRLSRLPNDAGSRIAYAIAPQPQSVGEPGAAASTRMDSFFSTILALFLRQAVLTVGIDDNELTTLLAPPGTDAHQPPALSSSRAPVLSPRRRIAIQDPVLHDDIRLALSLRLAELIRHVVTLMPGMPSEQMRAFPRGGGGAVLGVNVESDNTLTVSLRIQANEIAALQRMNRDGRAVLQERLFQMFSGQMLNLPRAGSDAAREVAP